MAVYLGVRNGILNGEPGRDSDIRSLPGREERDSQPVQMRDRDLPQSTWA